MFEGQPLVHVQVVYKKLNVAADDTSLWNLLNIKVKYDDAISFYFGVP